MRTIRLILIFIVGGLLTYLTYKFKYQSFFFDAVIWIGLIFLGSILTVWTIFTDVKLYGTEKRIKNFTLSFIALVFISVILTTELTINHQFDKPTLLKVFYDGDFNGTGIDFKTDRTYILDNSAIGLSNYYYGTYTIDGNKITLDKDKIDNIPNLKHLEIIKKDSLLLPDEKQSDRYLYQVDENGKVINNSGKYRVVIDNRKK